MNADTLRSNEYVLAIDFCLDCLDIALMAPDKAWLIPEQRFDNNWPGYLALREALLTHLGTMDQARLTVAGESTGLLWWHAFYHLSTDPDLAFLSPALALRNPAHVKHFRKALPEEDKCDPKDARLIGTHYRSVGAKHFYTFNPRYLPLRYLCRAYSRLTRSLASEKAFFLGLVYLTASEYRRLEPFSNLLGVTSAHVLTAYPDITALADIPLDKLAAALNLQAKGHLKDPLDNARKLHHVARDSYPLPDFLAPTIHTVMGLSLQHIRFMESQKNLHTSLIETELDHLPEAGPALAESGLGPVLVGGTLGEIQDTRRFITGRKYDPKRKCWRQRTYRDGQASVAKTAGLWWPRVSSGRFEGDDRHLARERNPYLRYWFVQAAFCLKRHQSAYAAYYQRKYNETKKHPHKRALILTARKAVRLIFALLHKGQRQWLEEDALP
jgi:hypothetical protein